MLEQKALAGERIRLRPVEEADIPHYVRWFNDPDVRHWLHRSERPEETLEWHQERYERHRNDPARVEWCIESIHGNPIGRVVLAGIDKTQGRAELYISIGEKEYWSEGCGTDATRLALSYAFADLRLRQVYLTTDEDNLRSIRCYEKCGFVREGLLRAHRLRYGQPVNRIGMAILREEWEAQPWR